MLGELYRRQGAWKFRAVGQGYASGLAGLATDFGISVGRPAAALEPTAEADAARCRACRRCGRRRAAAPDRSAAAAAVVAAAPPAVVAPPVAAAGRRTRSWPRS